MQYDNETKDLIEQLDKQAKEIQAKIDELKNGNCKCVRWRAKEGEEYWTLDACVAIPYKNEEKYCLMDNSHYKLGNYFKTKEEAEKYNKHLIITQKLKDIALRLNNGVEIDWSEEDQDKYNIYYSHSDDSLNLGTQRNCKLFESIYCLSPKFLGVALDEIGSKELREYIKKCQ